MPRQDKAPQFDVIRCLLAQKQSIHQRQLQMLECATLHSICEGRIKTRNCTTGFQRALPRRSEMPLWSRREVNDSRGAERRGGLSSSSSSLSSSSEPYSNGTKQSVLSCLLKMSPEKDARLTALSSSCPSSASYTSSAKETAAIISVVGAQTTEAASYHAISQPAPRSWLLGDVAASMTHPRCPVSNNSGVRCDDREMCKKRKITQTE